MNDPRIIDIQRDGWVNLRLSLATKDGSSDPFLLEYGIDRIRIAMGGATGEKEIVIDSLEFVPTSHISHWGKGVFT